MYFSNIIQQFSFLFLNLDIFFSWLEHFWHISLLFVKGEFKCLKVKTLLRKKIKQTPSIDDSSLLRFKHINLMCVWLGFDVVQFHETTLWNNKKKRKSTKLDNKWTNSHRLNLFKWDGLFFTPVKIFFFHDHDANNDLFELFSPLFVKSHFCSFIGKEDLHLFNYCTILYLILLFFACILVACLRIIHLCYYAL